MPRLLGYYRAIPTGFQFGSLPSHKTNGCDEARRVKRFEHGTDAESRRRLQHALFGVGIFSAVQMAWGPGSGARLPSCAYFAQSRIPSDRASCELQARLQLNRNKMRLLTSSPTKPRVHLDTTTGTPDKSGAPADEPFPVCGGVKHPKASAAFS